MFCDDGNDQRDRVRLPHVQRLHGSDQVPLRVQQPEEERARCLQERRVRPLLHLSGRRHQYLQHCIHHYSANWKRWKVS